MNRRKSRLRRRAAPVTERRSPRAFSSAAPPDDPRRHATVLRERLQAARAAAATEDVGGYDERHLIKITLAAKVSPEDVAKATGNVHVVSQEDDTLLLAFGSDEQLTAFETKLDSLAAGEHVSYRHVLYALQDLDRWTRDDRIGWALMREGFPSRELFVVDAELLSLERGDEMLKLRGAFERWVTEQGGEIVDSVRQPHLTMYRILCTRALAEDLLRHQNVRTLDLPARIGLEQSLVFAGRSQAGDNAESSRQRAGNCGSRFGNRCRAPVAGFRGRRCTELPVRRTGGRRARTRDLRIGHRALRRRGRRSSQRPLRTGAEDLQWSDSERAQRG